MQSSLCTYNNEIEIAACIIRFLYSHVCFLSIDPSISGMGALKPGKGETSGQVRGHLQDTCQGGTR